MASSNKVANAVKFVGHDASGLPMKRKQVYQACLPCRKRKKRCHHVEDSTPALTAKDADRDISGEDGPARTTRSRQDGSSIDPDRDTSDAAAQLLRFFHHASDKASVGSPDAEQRQQSRPMSPPPPFLGDLNPEGILVEATMAPAAPRKAPQADEDPDLQVIGFLPPASPHQSRGSPTHDRAVVATGSPKLVEESSGPFFSIPREDGSRLTIHVQDTAKFAALAQTLVNRGLADKVLPSDTEWAGMRDLYLARINPIFPIFDRPTLMDLPEMVGLRELIKATVCLAAATDPEAHELLTFKTPADRACKPPTAVSYDKYSHAMADFIKGRLVELQDAQQIPLISQIQVMALTSLYWQPPGRTERFEPLSLWAKMVSLVHTHGIHLGLLARTPAEGNRDGSSSRLFRCLYAIDRLIAAISARPVMFHNVDLIQVPRPDTSDPPIFRLFLSLILLLDHVFGMYRPRPTVSYVDMPVYERMVIEAGAQCEPDSLLATLEVFYHAIGVLSVRMPRHRFRTAPECDALHAPQTQHLPPSGVNARRSHSADRILDVIQNYKLSPVPFVPYASTLSLSVAYRKWRFSQLPMFRARGGADFKRVLPVVQELGAIWTTARINGQLGQTVMLKLDQSELSRKRAKRVVASGRRSQASDTRKNQNTPAEAHGRAEEESVTRAAGVNSGAAQTNGAAGPPGAPSTSRLSPKPTQANTAEPATSNILFGPSQNARGPLTPSTTSSVTERSQPPFLPLTWTTTWIADNLSNNTNNQPTNLPWPAPAPTAPRDFTSRPDPSQQAVGIPPDNPYTQPDDPIPLPSDLATHTQTTSFGETPPLAGVSSDGTNLEDFLIDDDALFRSWDPRFAQSVDFSFSSILDPGNPFAWPEYCDYMS